MKIDPIKLSLNLERPFPLTCGLDFLTLGLICIALSITALEADDWIALGFFAISGIIVAVYRLYQMLFRRFNNLASNVFVTFLLSFTIFFLVGPLLQVFGSKEEIDYSRNFFDLTADKAVLSLGANLTGFGISLVAGRHVYFESFAKYIISVFGRLPGIKASKIGALLVMLGFLCKIYVLYNDLFGSDVISGIFRTAQLLLPVGVFLHFKDSSINLELKSVIFISAVVLYSLGGLLEFNKTEILVPIVALVAGVLIRNLTLTRLTIGFGILGGILVVLQPIIGEGLSEALSRTRPSLETRLDLFRMAYHGDLRIAELENIGIWSRIDYTSPDVAAMWFYENGLGGDSYKLIPWLLVPRFLYSDKPTISDSGAKFTYKVKGYDTSSTGQGIFISGYYDLGWPGLFFSSILCGFILAWYRTVILAAQISKSTLLLIIGLLGHWLAFFVCGDYLSSYFGNWVTSMYLILLLIAFESILFIRKF